MLLWFVYDVSNMLMRIYYYFVLILLGFHFILILIRFEYDVIMSLPETTMNLLRMHYEVVSNLIGCDQDFNNTLIRFYDFLQRVY